jgi:hypothetical protein
MTTSSSFGIQISALRVLRNKISNAIVGLRPLNNTSLVYVKDTYVGDLSPKKVHQLDEINQMRYSQLNKQARGVKIKPNKKRFVHYNPLCNNYRQAKL